MNTIGATQSVAQNVVPASLRQPDETKKAEPKQAPQETQKDEVVAASVKARMEARENNQPVSNPTDPGQRVNVVA
ncbi:MAG: hypothetical protein PHV34_18650 [Verrucomicrobiae bacterium]|nr:hypothetical protein [Verrucomicrobiae bacterium]